MSYFQSIASCFSNLSRQQGKFSVQEPQPGTVDHLRLSGVDVKGLELP